MIVYLRLAKNQTATFMPHCHTQTLEGHPLDPLLSADLSKFPRSRLHYANLHWTIFQLSIM